MLTTASVFSQSKMNECYRLFSGIFYDKIHFQVATDTVQFAFVSIFLHFYTKRCVDFNLNIFSFILFTSMRKWSQKKREKDETIHCRKPSELIYIQRLSTRYLFYNHSQYYAMDRVPKAIPFLLVARFASMLLSNQKEEKKNVFCIHLASAMAMSFIEASWLYEHLSKAL